jgi:hypothetical protein
MKKLFTIFKAWSTIYWSIYFVNAFYKWDFYNPFWWVFELPNNQDIRQNVLMIAFFTCMIGGFFYFVVLDKNGKLIKTQC